ncbi:hypothetical protein AB1L12_04880 [Peribacillus frigoritolerans]|uniref:hypothetical protein n=1 Tax=Peribacillus frigoritolerans TaxID=450367 RepID=UPI0039A30F5F
MADSRRKGSGFLKSREISLRKKPQGNAILRTYQNKTRVTSCFFTVILIGWKKFATLLPNNWLAETPQTLASRRLSRQSAERERISEINLNLFKEKTAGKRVSFVYV